MYGFLMAILYKIKIALNLLFFLLDSQKTLTNEISKVHMPYRGLPGGGDFADLFDLYIIDIRVGSDMSKLIGIV